MISDIIKMVAAFFGFADKATAEVHDSNQRKAGANEVIAADNAAQARAVNDAVTAQVNTTDKSVSDSLRDGRF